MAEDYYQILGVAKNASQADIVKAYRELARKHHPDMNPDDKDATRKFQRIQGAFDVLNDPKKRELYDRYGSSFETMGASGPQGGARGWQGGSFDDVDLSQFFGDRFGTGGPGGIDLGELFGQFRRAGGGAGGRRGAAGRKRRGTDLTHDITIPFTVAILGGNVELTVAREDGKTETITVKIPAGIDEGKKIRLRGQGQAGAGANAGDLILIVHVEPHPHFQRKDNNLLVRVPVTLAEAALGAHVDIPTPQGTVSLRVPAGTSSGTKLRVKGHGVAPKTGMPGDLLAEIQIVLTKKLDEASQEAIRQIDQRHKLAPRSGLHW